MVRRLRVVGGVCEMCMARGGEGGMGREWVKRWGLGFTCVCVAVVCVVLGEWVGELIQGLGGWCGVMSVCVL